MKQFTKSVKQTIGRRREKIVRVPGAGLEVTSEEWPGRLLCRHTPTQFCRSQVKGDLATGHTVHRPVKVG